MFKVISGLNRHLILAIVVLLIGVYFVPIWYISLAAPQYPEGLSMNIWINKISGGTPYDLQNINLLNHYIGMAEIVETSIPELLFMPYILAYMIAGAIVTYFFPRYIMYIFGIVNFVLVASAGLYDFWRWEYNYGHNLKPDAAIVVPGMTYQPPLLFCKELLDITACSLPHLGAFFLFASLGILIFVVWKEKTIKVEN